MTFKPSDVIYSELSAENGATVVRVRGTRHPITIPMTAQITMRDQSDFFAYIAGEVKRRVRERLFCDNRHDAYKGFRV